MTSRAAFFVAGLFGSFLTGVIAEPLPQQKTVIPAGNPTAGMTLFVDKGCYQCHIADEIKTPASDLDVNLTIDLGGAEHAGWTRDDFARAIMNPNHTVSDEYRKIMMILGDHLKAENSPMPGFNEMLTVSDLIHLSNFLESLSE
jgi:cytochrome c551/c552